MTAPAKSGEFIVLSRFTVRVAILSVLFVIVALAAVLQAVVAQDAQSRALAFALDRDRCPPPDGQHERVMSWREDGRTKCQKFLASGAVR